MKPALCLAAAVTTSITAAMASCAGLDELSTVEQAYGVCDRPECSSNSPIVGDGVVFDELRTDQEYTPWRVKLARVEANQGRASLRIEGDQLVVVAGGAELRDRHLVGTILTLRRDNGAEYELRVASVTHTAFWYVPRELPLYELRFRKTREAPGEPPVSVEQPWPASEPGQPICLGEHLDDEPAWQALPYYAMVFRGEHFEGKKIVDVDAKDRRFNLACIGTASAKLHLLRHTVASGDAPGDEQLARSQAQRQAMLLMLTASYCGDGGVTQTPDGAPFTVTGQPLWYTWTAPWAPALNRAHPDQAIAVEAIWNADGAVCLDEPRRSPAVTHEAVEAACGHAIPRCRAELPWSEQGDAVSASPPRRKQPRGRP